MVRPPTVVTVGIEDLTVDIQEILDEYRIPGASIALVDRGRTIWAGGGGKADLAAGVDVTADHLFRFGSISKSFKRPGRAAGGQSGLLDLGTPVRELAPEIAFTNPWEATHPVTVAMLMEHTAGFDDLHFPELAVVDPEIGLAEGLAFHPHSRVSRWPPGNHMAYSNSGPSVRGIHAEREEHPLACVFLQGRPGARSTASGCSPPGPPRGWSRRRRCPRAKISPAGMASATPPCSSTVTIFSDTAGASPDSARGARIPPNSTNQRSFEPPWIAHEGLTPPGFGQS